MPTMPLDSTTVSPRMNSHIHMRAPREEPPGLHQKKIDCLILHMALGSNTGEVKKRVSPPLEPTSWVLWPQNIAKGSSVYDTLSHLSCPIYSILDVHRLFLNTS